MPSRNRPRITGSRTFTTLRSPSTFRRRTRPPAPASSSFPAAAIVCSSSRPEGVEPAEYLNSLGVAAFVLKHRLQREEGSTYTIERDARADAYRAMRTVRSRAAEFGVDPKRLGVMGFSAGGEVVGLIAFGSGDGDQQASDPIDRVNGRPDFAIFIYPGPLAVQATVPSTAPPAFLATASDDQCCSIPTLKILQQYKDAGVPVEAHVFAKGGPRLQHGTAVKAQGGQHLAAAPGRLAGRRRSADHLRNRPLPVTSAIVSPCQNHGSSAVGP